MLISVVNRIEKRSAVVRQIPAPLIGNVGNRPIVTKQMLVAVAKRIGWIDGRVVQILSSTARVVGSVAPVTYALVHSARFILIRQSPNFKGCFPVPGATSAVVMLSERNVRCLIYDHLSPI